MKRIVALAVLLVIAGCKDGQKIEPKKICDQAVKVCSFADQICVLDQFKDQEVCAKRAQVCAPAAEFCAAILAVK